MRTALTLSNDQITRMLAYAKDRMHGIESQRMQGWLEARERYERQYDDDFTSREWNSAVFAKSNESLGVIGGGIDFIRSRLLEEIFGVQPWLGINPRTRTNGTPDLADAISRHLTWKLGPEQIDYESHATEMITIACKLGECVSKVVHTTDVDHFERIASILIDGQTGQPVTDQNGEFVFEDNGTQVGQQPGTDGQLSSYVYPTGNPQIVLGADAGDSQQPGQPSVSTGQYSWREQIITDQRVRYVGAKAIPLHYKELYIPLNAKSIQDADFVAHKTTMRLSTVLQQLGMDKDGGPAAKTGPAPSDDGKETAAKSDSTDPDYAGAAYLQTIVTRIKSESAASKAASDQPNRNEGEGSLPSPFDGDPQFSYVEAYFTFDVFGDGRPIRVFFTFAYDSETPIFWDYISNVTPDGLYPFAAVVMNKVTHRWYGTSWFKKYELQANLIDKLLNQIIYRNHIAANPIKFRRKEAVVQWQDDQPFEVGPDSVLDLNDGFSAKDALDFAEVPELDKQTRDLLDMAVATWRTRSGISAATEGTFGATPAENTATGTQRIVATGNTQFKPIILDVKRGLEEELRMLARCQYYYQEDEEYTFQQNDAQLVGLLTRDKVRDLDLVLELKLTNLKATERLQQSQLAANLGQKFLGIPPQFQEVFASVYEQIFQALQIDDADEFFKSIITIGQQMAAQQAQQAQQQSAKRQIAETIAFKDLPPWAQLDALKELGWNPPAGAEAATQQQAAAPASQQASNQDQSYADSSNAGAPGIQAGPGVGDNGGAQGAQGGEPSGPPDPGGEGAGAVQLPHGAML